MSTETIEETVLAETVTVPEPRSGAALAVRSETHTLEGKLAYAQALAQSGMLPNAFRRQPANVLFAIEYGETLGLSPVAAMMGIYVIDNKPAAYASLISALVRKAHHRLRVGYDEQKMMGWAEIVRCDDPGFTFRSEWDLERAVTAELCTIKDGVPYSVDSNGRSKPWRKFFPSMTKARAITEAARDACEEALYGLHYTPEELGAEVDDEGHVIGGTIVSGPPAAQLPSEDTWYNRGPVAAAWVEDALAKAKARDLSVDTFRTLWTETTEKLQAGEITADDSKRIKNVLSGRADELQAKTAPKAEPADAEIVDAEIVTVYGLDPESDWAASVASIATQEDADAAAADVAQQAKSGALSAEDAVLVAAAIDARLAELAGKAAA
jgi:hypothetical protein